MFFLLVSSCRSPSPISKSCTGDAPTSSGKSLRPGVVGTPIEVKLLFGVCGLKPKDHYVCSPEQLARQGPKVCKMFQAPGIQANCLQITTGPESVLGASGLLQGAPLRAMYSSARVSYEVPQGQYQISFLLLIFPSISLSGFPLHCSLDFDPQ